ncbi:MAG: hypothetical protein M3317_16070, partial [Actinomycetota bacterium]|nr:hypothetical protein [Actinomycetota bacterium]
VQRNSHFVESAKDELISDPEQGSQFHQSRVPKLVFRCPTQSCSLIPGSRMAHLRTRAACRH